MKLSTVLRTALEEGYYNYSTPYMCWALENMAKRSLWFWVFHKSKAQKQVMAMVDELHPGSHTLAVALSEQMGQRFYEHGRFQLTKQFYVWWVFDLIRKGK